MQSGQIGSPQRTQRSPVWTSGWRLQATGPSVEGGGGGSDGSTAPMLRSAGRFVGVDVWVDVHRNIGQAWDLVQQRLAGRLGDPVAGIDRQPTVHDHGEVGQEAVTAPAGPHVL